VAYALEHTDGVAGKIGHGEVDVAVAVEIGGGHGVRDNLRQEQLGQAEGAVAVARQDVHEVGAVAYDGEILPAVVVEVLNGHRGEAAEERELLRLEGAIGI